MKDQDENNSYNLQVKIEELQRQQKEIEAKRKEFQKLQKEVSISEKKAHAEQINRHKFLSKEELFQSKIEAKREILIASAERRNRIKQGMQQLVNAEALIKFETNPKSEKLKTALENTSRKIDISRSTFKSLFKKEKELAYKIYSLEYDHDLKQYKKALKEFNMNPHDRTEVNNIWSKMVASKARYNHSIGLIEKELSDLIGMTSTVAQKESRIENLKEASKLIETGVKKIHENAKKTNYKDFGAKAKSYLDHKIENLDKQEAEKKIKSELKGQREQKSKLESEKKIIRAEEEKLDAVEKKIDKNVKKLEKMLEKTNMNTNIKKDINIGKEKLAKEFEEKDKAIKGKTAKIKELEKQLNKDGLFKKIVNKMSSVKIKPIEVGREEEVKAKTPSNGKSERHDKKGGVDLP
ncbi:MAG: hypothetical protein ACK4OM_00305 [Alphaproteobacteria bacterium]